MKVHGRRGVKIGGLWYGGDHPVLGGLGSLPSPRSGRHRGKWAVNRDPRDCRQVFIELAGQWHPLPWKGLPTGEDVLAFSDARVQQVLREAAVDVPLASPPRLGDGLRRRHLAAPLQRVQVFEGVMFGAYFCGVLELNPDHSAKLSGLTVR